MKIIVAHPDKQHSFQLAAALKKKGILFKYITTIYDRPQSLTNKLKLFLKGNAFKKAGTRSSKELKDFDIKQFGELNNLFIVLLSRIPKFKDLCRKLRLINAVYFGRKVARYAIKNNVDAVIMFDMTAMECFRILEKEAPSIKRILDVSIITRPFMKKVFEDEMEREKDNKIKIENLYLWDEKTMINIMSEICLSNYFLAPSNIVHDSIVYCGVSSDSILRVPYGVAIEKFVPSYKINASAPLKLIVVGQLNRRKGIHQLLSVVSQYSKEKVELFLVGGYENTSDIYLKYKNVKNIHFLGFLTHDVLLKEYHEADIFVLPSLAEGMALVGLEAMACGLPIICSNNTGINDAIIEGVNGFVIQAGDQVALKQKIDYFINNMERIPEMSRKSREIAELYTWQTYQEQVAQKILEIL